MGAHPKKVSSCGIATLLKNKSVAPRTLSTSPTVCVPQTATGIKISSGDGSVLPSLTLIHPVLYLQIENTRGGGGLGAAFESFLGVALCAVSLEEVEPRPPEDGGCLCIEWCRPSLRIHRTPGIKGLA